MYTVLPYDDCLPSISTGKWKMPDGWILETGMRFSSREAAIEWAAIHGLYPETEEYEIGRIVIRVSPEGIRGGYRLKPRKVCIYWHEYHAAA